MSILRRKENITRLGKTEDGGWRCIHIFFKIIGGMKERNRKWVLQARQETVKRLDLASILVGRLNSCIRNSKQEINIYFVKCKKWHQTKMDSIRLVFNLSKTYFTTNRNTRFYSLHQNNTFLFIIHTTAARIRHSLYKILNISHMSNMSMLDRNEK